MSQDDLYQEAASTYDAALERLVRAYEADPDKRRDLLQEIHIALWRSLEIYESRCSLRTWVYRVAHFTAASHVLKQRRSKRRECISLEEVESGVSPADHVRDANDRMALERLMKLIHRLKPLDRQLVLLYLEGMDAAAIGEITGISTGNVRTQGSANEDTASRCRPEALDRFLSRVLRMGAIACPPHDARDGVHNDRSVDRCGEVVD